VTSPETSPPSTPDNDGNISPDLIPPFKKK